MRKIAIIHATIFLVLFWVASSFGQQAVSEEARRHMARGLTAVEMGKSPNEYDPAIQLLSVQEVVDTLVSLSDEQAWQVTGNCIKYTIGFKNSYRDGWASVKSTFRLFKIPEDLYSDSKIISSGLKYSFVANTCPPGEHQNDYDCFGEMINEVSVVSKTVVKIRQKTLRQDPNGYIPKGERSCVFQKK